MFVRILALILCLMTHSSILSVKIHPHLEDRIVAIWSSDTKYLMCLPDNKDVGGSVRWFGPNGRQVGVSPLSAVYQFEFRRETSISSKLFFSKPYKVSAGVYECKHLRNNSEVSSESIEIKIFSPIDMSENLDQYTIDEGSRLEIECSAKFDSEYTEAQVIWIEDSKYKKNLSRHRMDLRQEDLNIDQIRMRNTLIIDKVNSNDAGIYSCQSDYLNQFLTDIKTIDIEVIVQYKPKLAGSPRMSIWIDEQIDYDDSHFILELLCQAHADPMAQFAWFIGNDNMTDNPNKWPSFITLQTKMHLSILRIHLRNLEKFRNFINNLKKNSTDIWCEASNVYGSDSLHFDVQFGRIPDSPEIIYFNKEPGFIFLEINYTNTYPPIDKFKLQLSKSHYVLFNASQRIDEAKSGHLYKIPYDPKVNIEYLDLLTHNPIGWSRPSVVLQDTTNMGLTTEQPYQHRLTNVQISVLLFIVFLFITSTSVQVIYFNFCVEDENTY